MTMLQTQILDHKRTMSSLEIAELTGKQHKHVLDDIRKVLEEVGIDSAEFSAQYKDRSGRALPCFKLPRRECDLVIAGYSAKYRLAIIDRWQELEAQQYPQFQIPQTLSEALMLAGRLAADKDAALAQIESDRPKVEFAMTVRNMQGACTISDFAKTIGYGRNNFLEMMRDDGLLMKSNMPYQRYIDQGIFVVIEQIPYTDSNGKTHPAFKTMITGKGQVFLEKKYRKEAVAA